MIALANPVLQMYQLCIIFSRVKSRIETSMWCVRQSKAWEILFCFKVILNFGRTYLYSYLAHEWYTVSPDVVEPKFLGYILIRPRALLTDIFSKGAHIWINLKEEKNYKWMLIYLKSISPLKLLFSCWLLMPRRLEFNNLYFVFVAFLRQKKIYFFILAGLGQKYNLRPTSIQPFRDNT